jgi:asparagine synthase (glutamine-hydrolysing)
MKLQLPDMSNPESVYRWLKSLAGLRDGLESFQRDKISPRDQLIFYDITPDFKMAHKNVRNMFISSFAESIDGNSAFDLFTFNQPWPQLDILMTRLICQTYLLENGITQGDRLSMASSVELRLPLLDYRLAEIVIGMRKSQTDYNLPPKTWLKAAIKGILPDWVTNRPKKGFTPPVQEWHKALFDAYGSKLDDGFLVQSGVLKPEIARDLSEGPIPSGAVSPLSFKALVLEIWCRQYFQAIRS